MSEDRGHRGHRGRRGHRRDNRARGVSGNGDHAVSRREMIQATAAVLAAPLLPVKAMAAPAAPAKFLTAAELALLEELTEMILPADAHSPGARAAGVARYIDDRLAESLDADWRARWRSGLQAVDALSRDLNGQPFLLAARPERVAVLGRMAAGESAPKTPLERFFNELKRWTVRGYYTSKVGIHDDQQYQGNVYQRGEFAGYDAK